MPKRIFQCASQEEAAHAQVGPPDIKPMGSRERAIQRLAKLKRLYDSASASVSRWEAAVEEAKVERSWEPLKYKSLDEMLKVEIGATEKEARERVIAKARTAKPAATTGRPKKGVLNTPLGKGTSSDRLTARIARDRPDILERMKAGDFPSVRQAAIAAGIVKVETPLIRVQRAWKVASDSERKMIREWITGAAR